MKIRKSAIYLVACLTATVFLYGCGSAFRVRQGTNKVDGIPFYVKEAKCLHKEVLVMPYYRLTLQTLEGQKVTGSETATVSGAYYLTDKTALELTSLINGTMDVSSKSAEDQLKMLAGDWKDIKAAGATDVYAKVADEKWLKYLVSNSSDPKIFVNYDKTYYLNTSNPLSGSTKADYKLAGDGTLTEASAEITNDTFKTIVSALPISDLIKSAAGIGLASKSVGGRNIQLKAENRLLKITKFQTIPFEPGCPDKGDFQSSPPVGTLIEDVGADTATATANKGEDNSITVSGKIVLPKSSSSAGAATGTKSPTDNPPAKPN